MGEVNKILSSENKNLDKEVVSFYDVKKLIEKNRIDEAIEMLNKIFVLTGDLKCHFELAKLYIKKHNYGEAINLLLSLVGCDSVKSYYVHYELCLCYFYSKKYNECFDCGIKTYESSDNQEKCDDYLYYMIISSANKTSRLQEGLSFIEKYPCYKNPKTVNQVISLYHDLKMNNKALEVIRSTSFEPENDYDRITLSYIYYDTGNMDKAYDVLNKMDKIDDSLMILKGKIEYRQTNYLESEKIFERLVKKGYRPSKTAYLLIKSQIRLGKIEEARNNLKLIPANLAKTEFLKATICIYSNELDEAENILEKLSENDGKYRCISLIYLASIHIRKHQYTEALNLLGFVYFNYKNTFDKRALSNVIMLISIAQTNIGIDIQKTNYVMEQVANYSPNATLRHMENRVNGYHFFKNIDLQATFDRLQELIADEYPKICACSRACDAYVVDFPSAGVFYDRPLDKMQVITVIGTKDIISFYPVSELSYWKNFDSDSVGPVINVKRLSQIEKFNKKYGSC